MEKVGTATLSVTTDHSIIGDVGNYDGTYTDNGGNVNADPLLKANNHLNLSSPAKDKAVCGFTVQLNGSSHYIRVAPYDDIDGGPRPGWGITTSCDIGADEYRFPWILFNPAFIKPQ